MASQKIVFRGGSATNRQLTPRPRKSNDQPGDMVAPEGQRPGLSVNDALNPGTKGQRIDVTLLQPPLQYFPDEPGPTCKPGHGVITPVTETGEVDQAVLEEWASCRETQEDQPHRLTQLVLDAIVERDVKG